MRISDWSSDVCSSDLLKQGKFLLPAGPCMPVALPAPLPAPTAVRRDGILASVAKEFEQPIEIARDQQAVQCNDGIEFLRSEEHTSELQSIMRNSYAVFCLNKKNNRDRRPTP